MAHNPRRVWLLWLLMLGCALVPAVEEALRGPVAYRPEFSDEPLLLTRSRLVRLAGTVAGAGTISTETAIGGYVTGREAEPLVFVAHSDAAVVPVAGRVAASVGERAVVTGRLRPTFPSVRAQLAAAPLKTQWTLHPGEGRRWWPAALLLAATLWVALRWRSAGGDAPALAAADVYRRRGSVAACLLLACGPGPLVAYLADGWLRPLALLLSLMLAVRLIQQASGPYLLLSESGLCINGLLRRRYLPWSAVRELSVLSEYGRPAYLYVSTDTGEEKVGLRGLLDNVEFPEDAIAAVGARAPEGTLCDWPENPQARIAPAGARSGGWDARQWVALAVCASGMALWWAAGAVCIANDLVIAWSFYAAFIAAALCGAGLLVELL